MAYATVDDLTTYYDGTGIAVPAWASIMLDRASRLVDQALICSIYETDVDGTPIDDTIQAALHDATIEQVAAWIDMGSVGIPTGYQSVSAGSVSLGRDSSSGAADIADGTTLAPQAFAVLQLAGITGYGPWQP